MRCKGQNERKVFPIKVLYISDLDGTLLNRDVTLSEYTTRHLNELIEKGVNFSVATARTAATCERILEKVHLNTPIILMNGVLVYDIHKKNYIKKEILTQEKIRAITKAIHETGVDGLLYTLKGETLATYYERISTPAIRAFIDERVQKYGKPFHPIESFEEISSDAIYFTFIDTDENIHKLYDAIRDVCGLHIEKYQDIYSDEGLWYMEVFADTASKYNAVKFLRDTYGYDKIIAFGDNLNDLPMFAASDVCYAVANAKDAVKAAATEVIPSNLDDGVIKQIEKLESV